jgi:hypothetical protein
MPSHETTINVNVQLSDDGTTLAFEPVSLTDQQLMERVLTEGGDEWHTKGTRYPEGATDKSRAAGWHFITADYRVLLMFTDDTPDTTTRTVAYFGFGASGVRIMEGSTPIKVHACALMTCWRCHKHLKASELALSKYTEIDGERALRATCDACAKLCDHRYKWGVGKFDGHVAHLPMCNLCGRADPTWEPSEDPAEDMAAAIVDGGLHAIVLTHPDGTGTILTAQRATDE